MIVIFSKAFQIFSCIAAHPEVYDRVRTKDEESLHQVISNKAEDVSSKRPASDVLYPLQQTRRPKKSGPKKSAEEKAMSDNLFAMMLGSNCFPVSMTECSNFQRWVHSLDPEVQ